MSAFFIYVVLLTGLFVVATIISKKKDSIVRSPLIWIAITLTATVVGMQSNPNVDWNGYYEIVSSPVTGNYALEEMELAPRYLSILLHNLGLSPSLWFVIMMWLIYLFLVLAANNGLKEIFPWIFFFFFLSLFSLSMIIIRQTVALSIILYAYSFIHQKKLFRYLLLMALAYCFHRSSLICLPLYWVAPLISFKSISLQIGIVSISILIGGYIVDFLWSLVPLGEEFRYAHYSELDFEYGEKSGVGVVINHLRYFTIILYSEKLKEKFNKNGFSIFYGVFFIEACIYNAFKNDLALSRIELYFSVADLVTSGFLFYYLFHSRNLFDKIVLGVLFSLVLVMFLYIAWTQPDWKFV